MKDNLENFIREHREEFDDLIPRETIWTKINQNLTPKSEWRNWIWKIAAMIFLGVAIGLLIERNQRKEQPPVIAEISQEQNELQHVEDYYVQLIHVKRQEITTLIEQQSFIDMTLLQDLSKLDLMYTDLKKDLEQNQNNEKLINAMIRNLQLRVEILNQQLNILEKLNKYQSDEEVII